VTDDELRGYDRDDLADLRGVLDDAVKVLDESTKDLSWWSCRNVPAWEPTLRRYGVNDAGPALAAVAGAGRAVSDVRERFVRMWSTVDTVIAVIDRLTDPKAQLARPAGTDVNALMNGLVNDPLFEQMAEVNRLLATGQLKPHGVGAWLSRHVPDPNRQMTVTLALPRVRQLAEAWQPPVDWHAGNPDDWARAVQPRGPGGKCFDPRQSHYAGNGFVTGPDGRQYPLVVPKVRDGDHHYTGDGPTYRGTGSVQDLGGQDPGWTTVYDKSGVHRFGPAPNLFDKWAAYWSPKAPELTALNPENLLRLGPTTGYPEFGPPPDEAGQKIPPKPKSGPQGKKWAWRPVGDGKWAWVDLDLYEPTKKLKRQYPHVIGKYARDPVPPRWARRVQTAQGVADLGASALQGGINVQLLGDDVYLRLYRIEFQRHPDGRVRALLRTYKVDRNNNTGGLEVIPMVNWVDRHGRLRSENIRWRPPKAPAPRTPIPSALDADGKVIPPPKVVVPPD
jgi:hypothetical protein